VQVGTNLSMVRLAAAAEFWLGKPVIAINTATYWARAAAERHHRQGPGARAVAGGVETFHIQHPCSLQTLMWPQVENPRFGGKRGLLHRPHNNAGLRDNVQLAGWFYPPRAFITFFRPGPALLTAFFTAVADFLDFFAT
jgi:hypothetical protein